MCLTEWCVYMAKINILDQDTINKIAAGEVVERPSSVVKELVENSIDAGATAVSVIIAGGGTTQIRVTDNGTGFDRDDLDIAFQKNTTSKIRCAEDLMSVQSLGFRGEALSSIAAVSKLELITKTRNELIGTRYIIHGGVKQEEQEVGCPDGTTFVVNDLFYNTPVRRKFLKSAMTEAGYVNDVMERIALSNPNVSIKFTNNGKLIINTSGNGKLSDVVYGIYGREIAAELCEVNKTAGELSIHGLIAKPVIARGNRNFENYFLNGRYIKNPLISKAIEEAYRGYMMQNKYPFTALMLHIPNEMFDVNVHPAKLEVRFTQPELIYEFVYQSVRTTVVGKESVQKTQLVQEEQPVIRPVPASIPEPFEKNMIAEAKPYPSQSPRPIQIPVPRPIVETRIKESVAEAPTETFSKTVTTTEPPKNLPAEEQETVNIFSDSTSEPVAEATPVQLSFLSEQEKCKHRIIGQLFLTYWLVEYDNKLYIIDQHAAHERVIYEKIISSYRNATVHSQQLYPPLVITLSLREQEVLEQSLSYFSNLGYEIESFGGNEYKLSAVPSDLPSINKKEFMLDILDDLIESGIPSEPESLYEKIASMSCKAAVKGNQKLSDVEAIALIDQLMELENPFHCPHGRPITIELSKYEIEKKFKRII